MNPAVPIGYRPAVLSDAAAIAAIEKLCFSDPWSECAVADTLKNPLAVYFCAEQAGRIVGYAGVYCIGEDADITNVAVLPECRRCGIAGTLLDAVVQACRQRGVSALHLEVRASNLPAIRLYEKYGFHADGLRRGYYRNPKEDAILMTKPLSEPITEPIIKKEDIS